MFCVKATIYTYRLDEDQHDLLRVHGYVNDSLHIYQKIYEMDDIRDCMCKLLSLLDDIDLTPYSIELERVFFSVDEDENKFNNFLDK